MLLPPNVKQVFGADHLCFLLHEVVEWPDLSHCVNAYDEEGGVL